MNKENKQLIFIGFRSHTDNYLSMNGYDFPLEAGGSNKNIIQDIDFLRQFYSTSLIIFDLKGQESISNGISCIPLTLFGFIKFLLHSQKIKSFHKTTFILIGTIGLGTIIKLFFPSSKVITVIYPPFMVLAWVKKNRNFLFSICYFICSIISVLVVEKIIIDNENNWINKTSIKNIKKKRIYLPNAVNKSIFYPEYKKNYSTNKELLYIGRLSHIEQKNPDLLYKAFELLCNDFADIKLTIIADSFIHFKELIDNKKILNQITFIKGCHTKDLPQYYRKSDLTILTSFFEGTPYVILESLACGTPCVCTNVLEDGLINNGINGYICNSFSANVFKETIKLGLELSEKVKPQNLNLLPDKFDLDKRNKQLLNLIEQV